MIMDSTSSSTLSYGACIGHVADNVTNIEERTIEIK
jgi:hypothetical protein